MRPIKLTMQAFGSYRDRTMLDFTKADQNLFLITGDTGARSEEHTSELQSQR